MISFGPFLTRSACARLADPKIESTGYTLEFSSAGHAARVPIYRRQEKTGDDFNDYLFCVQDAPVALRCRPYDSVQTEFGLFVRLESLIAAIYLERQVARPLANFLSEFRESFPLEKTSLFPNAKPQAAFKPELRTHANASETRSAVPTPPSAPKRKPAAVLFLIDKRNPWSTVSILKG